MEVSSSDPASELVEPEIERVNLLESIDAIFQDLHNSVDTIAVGGPQGIGKTIVLKQYSRRHKKVSIHISIKTQSRWACDPQYIMHQLAEQINGILSNRQATELDFEMADLRALYSQLHRKAKRSGEYYYFIIDGIEDIPETELEYRREIIALLPLGMEHFRFLLSIDPFISSSTQIKDRRLREFVVPGFTVDEAARFFHDLRLTEREIENIRLTCHGSPGLMASIRRSARSASDISRFVEELPKTSPDIFNLEWKAIDGMPEFIVDALAILAYDRKHYTTLELSSILGVDESVFRLKMKKLGFIEIGADQQTEYISEAFKQFAADRLKFKYKITHEKLIDYHSKTPSSDDALLAVPSYLNNIGKMEDLIKFLSPHYFAQILERSASLSVVRQKADLGIKAAIELNRDDDLVRFGVQLSSTRMLSGVEGWRNEIEARIALDDITGAQKLAQSALVCESRFHMLVVIAKVLHEQNRPLDQEVEQQILQLYGEIDYPSLGDKAFEIASDLLFVRPDLAMEIVETVSKNRATKPESLDWALAKLSVEADSSLGPSNIDRNNDIAQSIRSRITDPVAQQFSRVASMLLGRYSANEAASEAAKIPNAANRITFLRMWITGNSKKVGAAQIAEQALQLAIETTSYSLTASVLRDLAISLSCGMDEHARQHLLSMFDAQKTAAANIGPTEDYIDFWLLLTKARISIDRTQAHNDLMEIYFHISSIRENSTRAACLARLMALLPEIDPDQTLENKEHLHSIVDSEFVSLVDTILLSSADHIVATSSILKALAVRKPSIALQIATRLNSPIRRDEARLIIIRTICKGSIDESLICECLRIAENIAINEISDASYEAIIGFVFEHNDSDRLSDSLLKRLAMLTGKLKSSHIACRLISSAIGCLSKKEQSVFQSTIEGLHALLGARWKQIDSAWIRVDAGFEIAKRISKSNKTAARDFVSQADTLRRDSLLGSGEAATAFYWCMKLVVVAYSGLFYRQYDCNEDRRKISELVDRIPCRLTKLIIWSDIAFRYYLANRKNDCAGIASMHLRPLIDGLLSNPNPESYAVIAQCMPCLYFSSQLGAIDLIKTLPYPYNDHSISNIKGAILHRRSPFDVWDQSEAKYETIQYDEIVELLELAKHAKSDYTLYYILSGITSAVTQKRNRDRISGNQQAEIARRIEDFALNSFPKVDFIAHAGWKILSLACVAKIKKQDKVSWQNLVDQARLIDNVADRVLVLVVIAGCIPSSFSQLRKDIIEQSYQDAQTIPVIIDRIMRLRLIAEDCIMFEPDIARKCLTTAMKVAINVEDDDNFALNERRRIVDLAYKIEPKLAEEIAVLGDNDPARVRARHHMTEELAILKRKQQIMNSPSIEKGDKSSLNRVQNTEAAWRTLAALNAGKVQRIDKSLVREQLRYGSMLSFEHSFPSFLLSVTSLTRKYADTDEASSYLRPIFDGLVRSAELAWQIISRSVGLAPQPLVDEIHSDSSSFIVIPNQRAQAIQFIEKWIAKNVRESLTIADPYFGPEELELVARFQAILPTCEFRIVTSLKHQQQIGIADSMAKAYINHWRIKISDAVPPNTEIYVLSSDSDNRSPIHDRWILAENVGLNIGTSFNSLGDTRCAIDQLQEVAAKSKLIEIEKILSKQIRMINGHRIKCQNFDL